MEDQTAQPAMTARSRILKAVSKLAVAIAKEAAAKRSTLQLEVDAEEEHVVRELDAALASLTAAVEAAASPVIDPSARRPVAR
jgi:hypothetical protein